MEQLKILEIINHWGYLNIYQIAMLLNKDVRIVDTLVRILKNKKLLRVDQLTRKKHIHALKFRKPKTRERKQINSN
ncbi:hypothetical protein SIXOD_v1c25050 [Spiroplasma ixodetis Y32]|nr:hypothetical protein SIXOD_v1c25050 [Spiroplasma ixodetis Y32]